MRIHLRLLLCFSFFLTACGSDPVTLQGPDATTLKLWTSDADLDSLKGTVERYTGGLLYFDFKTSKTSGLEIPGHGVFLVSPTSGRVLPLLQQPLSCPGDTNWNWVGLTSPGTSDDAGTSFYGTMSWLAGALSFPTRLNLTAGADTGSATVMLTGLCNGGYLQGHSSNGTSWYLRGANALSGHRSTTAGDYVLALPQAQVFSGDLVGTYTAIVVRQVSTGNLVNFARFTVTAPGVNAVLTGNPISMPSRTTDATTKFNLGLSAFNQGTNGVAIGTATIEASDFSGGVSVAMNLKCIAAKTLGTLEKPVIYCVSQGYGANDDTLTSGKSFHYILRAE